jgi:arginine decarboxylase
MRPWTVQDSADLYSVPHWGADYFDIDKNGHMVVMPRGPGGPSVSLFDLVEDLRRRGYELPVLLRFSDILNHRVQKLFGAFQTAISEFGYRGRYRGVYPIKVNQQRDVVEELVEFGRKWGLGLEAGSKPELLVALAHNDNPDALIICNGYKDSNYIETAMLAQELGRYPVLVLDRFEEVELAIAVSRRLEMRPHLGARVRLNSRGSGKWVESGGARAKFGLTAAELIEVTNRLRQEGMLDCLELVHFHIGSQITNIRSVKDALREASRVFVELSQLGAGLKFIDVGGGLAVDYDGSKTAYHSSMNYSMQEYANDVVYAVGEACDKKGIPHPDIVSESGRALVAHHSVLVFNVLGVDKVSINTPPPACEKHPNTTIQGLYEVWKNISRRNYFESYHDAMQMKEEAFSLFDLGYLDLDGRAVAERLFWAICDKIMGIVRELDYVPDDLQGLERALADTYFCNFSVFQSAPDHWAVKQLFPVMPIHRLNEQPLRKGTLVDLTCDSDGKMDKFISLREEKSLLELHAFDGTRPYYLGLFLVGAYQEILGDLHNLFGDTTAIHVSLDQAGNYQLERVVEGDSVNEVLGYVQYSKQELVSRVRTAAEKALRAGALRIEKFALLLRRYEGSLAGYTYLAPDEVVAEVATPPAPASHGGRSNGGAVPLPANPPAQPTPSREPSTPSGSTA